MLKYLNLIYNNFLDDLFWHFRTQKLLVEYYLLIRYKKIKNFLLKDYKKNANTIFHFLFSLFIFILFNSVSICSTIKYFS